MFVFGGYAAAGKELGNSYPACLKIKQSGDLFFNNQLVYYDPQDNSWNWPTSYGDVPSPCAGAKAFSINSSNNRSLAVMMGGWANSDYFNDLFILDMDSMRWQAIKGSPHLVDAGLWPKERRNHSMTLISQKSAVLFGGNGAWHKLRDCWLLNIDECIPDSNAEKECK